MSRINSCKPDAKKMPPLTSPAPEANGDSSKGGLGNNSIDMPLSIVGISDMQKCGLKYDI
jgi:hypothetical protein